MKGIIALDIDGTITDAFHSVPVEVVTYLHGLVDRGWNLVFITGRPFQWSFSVLKTISFPYFLAVQNGAIILEMPTRRVVSKKQLDSSVFSAMDSICKEEETDYVIYGGYEHNDACYYRPSRFSPRLLDYLNRRVHSLSESYQAVLSYDRLSIHSFPSIKCFGVPEVAERMAFQIQRSLGLHVTPVTDPFDRQMMVIQATHADATKGCALNTIRGILGVGGVVIAAGNDYNDESMLAVSDIKVVMSGSPADLLDTAHITAPSVEEMGIIAGLEAAIELYQEKF